MWPFIKDGDSVTIKGGGFVPGPGVIVALFVGDQLIVHRIVRCQKRSHEAWDLWVRGDSSPTSCAKISTEQVIGTVVALSRRGVSRGFWLNPFCRQGAVLIGYVLQTLLFLKKRWSS